MVFPALAAIALVAYFGLWPVPIAPVAWQAPEAPGYVGPHAANTRLAGLNKIALGAEMAPEHIAIGPDGKLYTGVDSGKLLRMNADGSAMEVYADTGGRPLGIDFDAHGTVIVADAVRGLLAIAPDRAVTVLTDRVDGDPIRLADGVAVAANGKIYLSDATTRFAASQWGAQAGTLDILEQSASGRVLEYDPASGRTRILARGLSLANGIVISNDEQSVFVCESGRYRVWRIALSADGLDLAQPSAQAQVVLDNLPGHPDNLTRGQQGRIWLGLAAPRTMLDAMADKPFLRKVTMRVPQALWPLPKPYGHVIAFLENGQIVADLQDPGGGSFTTTGATETADRLYVHNLDGGSIGWRAR